MLCLTQKEIKLKKTKWSLEECQPRRKTNRKGWQWYNPKDFMIDYYYYDQIWAIGNQFSGGMDTDCPCYKANIPYGCSFGCLTKILNEMDTILENIEVITRSGPCSKARPVGRVYTCWLHHPANKWLTKISPINFKWRLQFRVQTLTAHS